MVPSSEVSYVGFVGVVEFDDGVPVEFVAVEFDEGAVVVELVAVVG